MKKGIRRNFIFHQIMLGALLIICMGIIIGVDYSNYTIETLKEKTLACVKTVSEVIDGDKVIGYVNTKEKNDYYNMVQKYINLCQKNTKLLYLYVIFPRDNGFTYVWDGVYRGNYAKLGDNEEYSPEGRNYVNEVFERNVVETVKIFDINEDNKIMCCMYPVYNSNDVPVAFVGADISIEQLGDDILEIMWPLVVGVVVIIGGFTMILFFVTNKRIIKPIRTLREKTEKMSIGKEKKENTHKMQNSMNEIENLSKTYETMEDEIKKNVEQIIEITAEKERISAELDVAAKMQADMLPSVFPPFPEQHNFDIFASMEPAREVGGDFYDFFIIDDNRVAIVIADVSGKGVPAALFMVNTKNKIKNRTLQGGTPADILTDVNNKLCEHNKENFFVTVWLATINIQTGEVLSANGGHENPAVKPQNGQFSYIVKKHSLALGVVEDYQYVNNRFQLNVGDRLFVYTDGIPEMINKKEEQYGTARMLKFLNKKPNQSLKGLLTGLSKDVKKFAEGKEQFDDMTMLIFDYKRKKK